MKGIIVVLLATALAKTLPNQPNLVLVRSQGSNYMPSVRLISLLFFLSIADPPRIYRPRHPQELKDIVPGKPVTFTVGATGETLTYQWQWKPAEEGSSSEEWQRFPGADSPRLTISSVEKSNEGSFRCVISNRAGSQTSEPAILTVGMNVLFY